MSVARTLFGVRTELLKHRVAGSEKKTPFAFRDLGHAGKTRIDAPRGAVSQCALSAFASKDGPTVVLRGVGEKVAPFMANYE